MPQVFLLLLIDIFATAAAHLCFKMEMLRIGTLHFSFSNVISLISQIFQSIWILTGVFLLGISFILWLFILSKLQLNIVYPIALSSQVIIITAASWFLFREYLSTFQIMGIAVIMVGIFLLLIKG